MASIEKMRNERTIPQVALQSYNVIRSKNPETIVFVFEGPDDVFFYDTIIEKITSNAQYIPLRANGKDQVLGLRKILKNSKEQDTSKVAFFVDHDYDGLKGQEGGPDIYCTEQYSIENILVNERVLEKILRADLRCDDNEIHVIETLIQKYREILAEYKEKLFQINLVIYCCRKNRINIPGIGAAKKYLSANTSSITIKQPDTFSAIGWPTETDKSLVENLKEDFNKLDPIKNWRGKFLFYIFQEFIVDCIKDRTSDNRSIFSKKVSVQFNPKTDLRTFALYSPTPDSLSRFIRTHLNSENVESTSSETATA